MRKAIVVLCGLIAAAPSAWSAQTVQPLSKEQREQLLEKRRQASRQFGRCVKEAEARGYKPGTREFYQALGACRRRGS